MEKLRASATRERASNTAKGSVYPPLTEIRLLLKVAIKDAAIRLKLIILKLVGKCFAP